jgi:hypothetical protein
MVEQNTSVLYKERKEFNVFGAIVLLGNRTQFSMAQGNTINRRDLSCTAN